MGELLVSGRVSNYFGGPIRFVCPYSPCLESDRAYWIRRLEDTVGQIITI